MAPSNGTTSTPPKLVITFPPTIAHYNGTLQCHHIHSPKPPPNHSTLQWHPTTAPAMAPRPLHPAMALWCHHRPPQPWHTIMAPCNGTTSTPPNLPPNHSALQWHPTIAPSNGTLVPRPIRQSGSSPSPCIGSKNLYSYRYLGKNASDKRIIGFQSSKLDQNLIIATFAGVLNPYFC